MLTAAEVPAWCPGPFAAWERGCRVQGAAKPPLERRDPFQRPKRSSVRWWAPARSAPSSRGRSVLPEVQQNRGSWAQGRRRCPLVILAREMGAGARPWPLPSTAHQPRDCRIKRDVTRDRQEVRLVHHHRAEAGLEQMARPVEPRVDGPGGTAVRFGKVARSPSSSAGVTIRWT